MRNILTLLLLMYCSSGFALQYANRSDPPMSSDDFDNLAKSLEAHIASDDYEILSVEHCNHKTLKLTYVTLSPHFVQGTYQESYYFYCTRDPSSITWGCDKPTILKSLRHAGATIRIFGSATAAEANELTQFIAGISTESFTSLNEQELQVPEKEISGYKKIFAISKEKNIFKVTVEGGKGGNTLMIRRVQCGLKQCALGVSNVVWEIN